MHFKSLVVVASGLVAFASAVPIESIASAADDILATTGNLIDKLLLSEPVVNTHPAECTEKEFRTMRSMQRYINWLHNRRTAAQNGKYPSSDILPVPNVAEFIENPYTCQALWELLEGYPIIRDLQ
ncbi:hypothetical protein C0993_009418 [Termitomyces sp. T159_Od127]|nr:hypothetical protein C0993_009418 [Termitomyces sp. T159_Od127]